MTESEAPGATGTGRVALLTPGLEEGGGVPAVSLFLHRVMTRSGRYRPEFVSLPMSSRDPDSVRLVSPGSWLRGVRESRGTWQELPYRKVGARWVELEFQRYRERRPLTRLLEQFDIVQLVAGCPGWGMTLRRLRRPFALQVATLARAERQEILARARGAMGLWRRWMTAILARYDEAALSLAGAVFVENQWMYDHVHARIGDRAIFAPPGIDTARFSPPESPAAPRRHILSVGRFDDPRKKISLLFEAYGMLRDAVPTAPPLVLAGNAGPLVADWKLADELGIRNHITFHERVSEDRLVELYRRAVLFGVSSDEEGLGVAILEAMACAVPVISTDCGGPATSVVEGRTGHLVPRGDAAALARGMAAILADPSRAEELGRRARQRAVAEFSVEASGSRFLAWYDQALLGSRA